MILHLFFYKEWELTERGLGGGGGWVLQMIIATRPEEGGEEGAPPIVTDENLALLFEMQAKVSDVAACGWSRDRVPILGCGGLCFLESGSVFGRLGFLVIFPEFLQIL